MTDALGDGLRSIAVFVPKLLLFLVILGVGYLIAKAVAKALSAILERVGFDGAVERGGVKRALEQSRYDASEIVGRIIFYALLLFVLQLAFGVFPANPVSDLLRSIIGFLPLLIIAIIIIVIAAAIAAAVREVIVNALGGLSYGRTLGTVASVFILGIGIIAALNQINVATSVTTPILVTVLATIGGILVVGVGGGLIRPMSERWEGYLTKAEEEAPKVRESARNATSVREQARRAQAEFQNAAPAGDERRSGPSRQGSYSYESADRDSYRPDPRAGNQRPAERTPADDGWHEQERQPSDSYDRGRAERYPDASYQSEPEPRSSFGDSRRPPEPQRGAYAPEAYGQGAAYNGTPYNDASYNETSYNDASYRDAPYQEPRNQDSQNQEPRYPAARPGDDVRPEPSGEFDDYRYDSYSNDQYAGNQHEPERREYEDPAQTQQFRLDGDDPRPGSGRH